MDRLHLGLDYGTSASKLVLRHFDAPGGERAYLLEPNDKFRISSAVSFAGNEIVFCSDEKGALRSLKMRFAGEVTRTMREHFYGSPEAIPFGFSAGDLATLTVWKLISIGHISSVNLLRGKEFKMGMTMGIPMSFLDDAKLRLAFLRMARVAYQMYTGFGPVGPDRIDYGLARELLADARSVVDGKPPVQDKNFRNWMRSETEASMLWSFRSPATKAQQFFCVDVGAGTTDSSAFQINETYRSGQWTKDSLCFFGAHSHPYAMDAIDGLEKRRDGYSEIRDGLVRACRKAYLLIKDNYYSVKQWESPQLLVLGGGAFEAGLCQELSKHPMVNFDGTVIARLDLLVPTDLVRIDRKPVETGDIAFTSVAYGLAQIDAPAAARPTEVQPVRNHAIGSLPNHEEIYLD